MRRFEGADHCPNPIWGTSVPNAFVERPAAACQHQEQEQASRSRSRPAGAGQQEQEQASRSRQAGASQQEQASRPAEAGAAGAGKQEEQEEQEEQEQQQETSRRWPAAGGQPQASQLQEASSSIPAPESLPTTRRCTTIIYDFNSFHLFSHKPAYPPALCAGGLRLVYYIYSRRVDRLRNAR